MGRWVLTAEKAQDRRRKAGQGGSGVGEKQDSSDPGVTTVLLTGKDDTENATLAKLKTSDNCGFLGRHGRAVHLGKTNSGCLSVHCKSLTLFTS